MDDATRLRAEAADLALGERQLCRVLGRERRLLQRWLAGSRPVPPEVWRQLAALRSDGATTLARLAALGRVETPERERLEGQLAALAARER